MKIEEQQALAIMFMAEDRVEYNFGVLTMLGKLNLAMQYGAACSSLDAACSSLKNSLNAQCDDRLFKSALKDPSTLGLNVIQLVATFRAATERRSEIWAEIEKLKEDYRELGKLAIRRWLP